MKKISEKPFLVIIILVLGCLAIPAIGYFSSEGEATPTSEQPSETPLPTSTLPPPFKAKVAQPSFCHNGPNENYLGAIIVSANADVEVLAMNSDGDWFMIRGEGIDTCWIKASALILPPNIDLVNILKFVTVITTENTPCMIYPGAGGMIQTVIPKDWRIVLYGKSDMDANWVLVVPHNSTSQCWVEKNVLPPFESVTLPIEPVDVAFSPTPTPTLTLTTIDTPTPTNTPTATRRPPVIPTYTNTPKRSGNDNPPTSIPPTSIPPTSIPPTSIPPTSIPPTSIPPTSIPPTSPPEPTATLCWPPGHCK